jgi:murein DD-endopeptidase MepM/ murein hydrolase activator NlpD
MRELIAATVAALVSVTIAPATDWTWPLDDSAPTVVQGFDPADEPWLPGHRGVDLMGAAGDVVRAAGAGTVSYAGLLAGVGVVTVSHGVARTTYQPVQPSVAVGQRVEIGEPIGVLTITGSHCRPSACLHWGLIQGADYLDPLRLVSTDAPPRLLPLGTEALRPADGRSLGSRTPPHIAGRVAVGALAGIAT